MIVGIVTMCFMSVYSKFLWIFSDDSHRAEQAYAIAKRLESFEIREFSAGQLTRDHMAIISADSQPSLIVGAGAKSAYWCLVAKRLYPHSRNIIFLDPQQNHDDFDVIITPSYEPHFTAKNVFTTTGLVNRFHKKYIASLQKESPTWPAILQPTYPTKRIALLLGGRHIAGTFTATDSERLANLLNHICVQENAQILLSTSRRTELKALSVLQKTLKHCGFFYDIQKPFMQNPYDKMLAVADALVVTNDSLRMASEACSSGKPVYIFEPNESSPYNSLHQELFEGGHAVPLIEIDNYQSGLQVNPLDEAARIISFLSPLLH